MTRATKKSWPRPVPLVGDKTSAAARRSEPSGWRFDDETREAFYAICSARRDVRRYRPQPIDDELVERVLSAAHKAPSVGLSQPWRFVVVRSAETREKAAVMAEGERLRQASLLDEDSSRRMLDLQLDGVREAPLGLVVCCDRRTRPEGVLGRATFADADLWSCACAIENLWLAARAEGLGVGWVTLFRPDELRALVNAPEGIEVMGWLCLGWPDERPPAPGLERAAWARRAPLEEVVVSERFSDLAPAPPRSRLRAPDQLAVVSARDEADALLTPPGSLGSLDRALDRLGSLGIRAGSGATLLVVAADHPVSRHAVSAYETSVTREVLQATIEGESLGAAAALSSNTGVLAVDAGVSGARTPGALSCRPREPRGDLVGEDALSAADTEMLVSFGRRLTRESVKTPLVALGEVGVANTTVAALIACILLGLEPEAAAGLGAGGDASLVENKIRVLGAALSRICQDEGRDLEDPMGVLAAAGGPEIAVLTGAVLGAAEAGRAVVLDGLATGVAALLAVRLEPGSAGCLVAGQRSRERAHKEVLEALGLEPLLDLRLRAGEGVGAVLSLGLLRTALATREAAGRVGE